VLMPRIASSSSGACLGGVPPEIGLEVFFCMGCDGKLHSIWSSPQAKLRVKLVLNLLFLSFEYI
jgi:hypothetical protein